MIARGNLRADKVAYPDGIGYCVWYPFEGNEDNGVCFDFPEDDIDDFIAILQELKTAKAEPYTEPSETESLNNDKVTFALCGHCEDCIRWSESAVKPHYGWCKFIGAWTPSHFGCVRFEEKYND